MENVSSQARVKKEFKEFAKSFTEAEWDLAEALADIGHALCPDLTTTKEILFVRAGMERKRANPSAPDIEAIDAGLVAIGKPPIVTQKKGRRKSQLSGARI